tara:strand:+ start:36 stop:629 length:594 start_codon:yes stop_codon:yes gene_type:complete
MPFWNSTDIQIKQKSKFVVSFAGTFFLPNVKSVTKPSITVATKDYTLLNHVYNYPGIAKWEPIQIVFVDMNGNGKSFDTAGFLTQMLNNSGYTYPHIATHKLGTTGGPDRELSTPEKSSTIANAFGKGLYDKADFAKSDRDGQNVLIQQLSPAGNVVESWRLINPLIKAIKYGELTYDSDDPVEYTLEVIYDYAIYN